MYVKLENQNKICKKCKESCKQDSKLIIVTCPGYKLKERDKLVLFGKDEKIEEFKKTVI